MIYRFGDWELDTERYELRGADGAKPVEPQVFDLLRYLVENRDRTVTKDEIHKTIWKERIVSESMRTICASGKSCWRTTSAFSVPAPRWL